LFFASLSTIETTVPYAGVTLLIAPNRQTPIQLPQRVQISGSIVWGFLIAPLMAETGQTFAQAVQPTHFDSSI